MGTSDADCRMGLVQAARRRRWRSVLLRWCGLEWSIVRLQVRQNSGPPAAVPAAPEHRVVHYRLKIQCQGHTTGCYLLAGVPVLALMCFWARASALSCRWVPALAHAPPPCARAHDAMPAGGAAAAAGTLGKQRVKRPTRTTLAHGKGVGQTQEQHADGSNLRGAHATRYATEGREGRCCVHHACTHALLETRCRVPYCVSVYVVRTPPRRKIKGGLWCNMKSRVTGAARCAPAARRPARGRQVHGQATWLLPATLPAAPRAAPPLTLDYHLHRHCRVPPPSPPPLPSPTWCE